MRRREFITFLGGAAVAWPLDALAQQPSGKVPRIGFLTRATDASVSTQIDAFRQSLRGLGWVEGKSISIEYRDAEGQADRLSALAAELVALNVDVNVTVDTPPTQAAKQATSTIPIVIAVSADPVGAGLVNSLAQLGGNTTGMSLLAPETDQKNLELLKETLPKTRRVGLSLALRDYPMFHPDIPIGMRVGPTRNIAHSGRSVTVGNFVAATRVRVIGGFSSLPQAYCVVPQR